VDVGVEKSCRDGSVEEFMAAAWDERPESLYLARAFQLVILIKWPSDASSACLLRCWTTRAKKLGAEAPVHVNLGCLRAFPP
jgi:hypothetical protein